MSRFGLETSVGIFLIVGFLSFAYIAIKMGDLGLMGDHYPIKAKFVNVSGLKKGANVELAGVIIGKVEDISIEKDTYMAIVTMLIKNDIKITDDSVASIKTAGIIGDKYIKITPGASENYLKPNDVIKDTESTVDIEELISKYIFEKK